MALNTVPFAGPGSSLPLAHTSRDSTFNVHTTAVVRGRIYSAEEPGSIMVTRSAWLRHNGCRYLFTGQGSAMIGLNWTMGGMVSKGLERHTLVFER